VALNAGATGAWIGPSGPQLVVDWIKCEGHGLCAELLPEVVTLDDWGYPIIGGPVPPHLEFLANRAKAACPVLALRLSRTR
jgi:ferredoxin